MIPEQVMSAPSADDPALAALTERFTDYHFRRNGRLWVATRRDEHPLLAPTLIEDTLAALVRALASPPTRAGRPFGVAR